MGVGSEVYGAVVNGRKGIGIELKGSYFKQAKKNLALATRKAEQDTLFPTSGTGAQPTVFDAMESETAASEEL
jgi:hypothetical protein